jgi:acyl-coenzyme A thioesterase PaaI-like protein
VTPAGFVSIEPRDPNGPIYLKRAGDDAVFGLRLEMRHCTPAQVAHGSVLVGLVDHAMSYVIHEVLERPSTLVSLTCDFLGPAQLGDWLEVRCSPTRVAIELVFMRGEARANGERVMTASGVWKKLGRA